MQKQLSWIAIASALAVCNAVSAEAAGNYPTKPVTIITPAAAGNGPDVIARIIAEGLSKAWGPRVLVLNRPGGFGGLIAAQAAIGAPPRWLHIVYATFVHVPRIAGGAGKPAD